MLFVYYCTQKAKISFCLGHGKDETNDWFRYESQLCKILFRYVKCS